MKKVKNDKATFEVVKIGAGKHCMVDTGKYSVFVTKVPKGIMVDVYSNTEKHDTDSCEPMDTHTYLNKDA